jgi:uncharacterized membrane protein YqjE
MDSIYDVRTSERAAERTTGMLDAGRRLLAAVWEHAEVRLELLTVELAEERARIVNAALAAGLLVVFAQLASVFIGICVLVAVWDTSYRLWTAIALPVLFAIGAFVSFMTLRRMISRETPLFRHSLAEWRRDIEEMRDSSKSS